MPPPPTVEPSPTIESGVVLVGAGDIAVCDIPEPSLATARLLENIPGTIFSAGDSSNDHGLPEQYDLCFQPAWGSFKERIRPAAGNHDYVYTGGEPYHTYYGPAAGPVGSGYYSYELGSWHIIVLNSNCDWIGGCEAGSAMHSWLLNDLASHPTHCSLAYWHHALYSSGLHGPIDTVKPFWETLYSAGAELVINGHDHHYERFTPQTPHGTADPDFGIRQFIVGTGGAPLYPLEAPPINNSEITIDTAHGVLKLTLYPDHYDWQFIGVNNQVLDSGTSPCH